MLSKKLPLIKVSGSHYDMGYQCGHQCSEKIRRLTNYILRKINERSPTTLSDAIFRTKPFISYVEEYTPNLAEEMKGMADGAAVSLEEAYLPHVGFMFVMNLGCTTLAISADKMSESGPIMGKNKDWDFDLEDLGTMVHFTPHEGPVTLMYTWAGTFATDGINSEGLGVFSNGLWCEGSPREGLPMSFIYRHLLEQSTVDDAIGVIRKIKRSQSFNFLLAHVSSEIKNLETTIDDDRVLEAEEGYLVHTNHYLSPDFLKFEKILEYLPDSPIRHKTLDELIRNEKGKIKMERIKAFLADHMNYPKSICRHQAPDNPKDPYKNLKTLVSMISDLDKRIMYAAIGNPCQNQYHLYQI